MEGGASSIARKVASAGAGHAGAALIPLSEIDSQMVRGVERAKATVMPPPSQEILTVFD
jgi:hypothetical protein